MRFIHYRFKVNGQPKSKGGVTFAYDEDDGRIWYSVAKCSPKDNYCKRIGRSIATGRWDKGISTGSLPGFVMVGKLARREIEQAVIDHYANN